MLPRANRNCRRGAPMIEGGSPPLMVVAAIEDVDQVQTKYTSRHREGTRKPVQGICAEGARTSITRCRRHAVSAHTSRLANTQMKARYAQAVAEYAQRARTCSASTRARRNATHLNGGWWPERARCGHEVEACGRRLGVVLEPVRRTTGFRTPGCSTCRLVPSSIDYASQKWSRKARTDATERAAACASTMPRGPAVRIRARIGRPCQRPGPLLAPSLPSSHPLHSFLSVCVCCFVLLNRYWGIVTVPGSFLKAGDLGWPDPHPAP